MCRSTEFIWMLATRKNRSTRELRPASRTIERGGPQLRQASAAARQELLKLASARLDTPVDKLTVTDGVVSVVGNPARKISYGNLLGGKRFNVKIVATGNGWDMKVAPGVPAKNPKDYKIVGTSVPRIDLPEKFTGEFTYTQDVRVPGMLHGRVVRPTAVVSKPSSVDESSIRHIAGVVKVVQGRKFRRRGGGDRVGGDPSGEGFESDLVRAGNKNCRPARTKFSSI